MEHYIFTLTSVVTVLSLISFLSIMFSGRSVDYPSYGKHFDPTSYLFLYPSILYQAWYWSGVLIFN